MTPAQFLPIFIEYINVYYISLFISLFVYLPVIYRLTYNVFDPLLFILIGALFSHALVVFLYGIDLIKLHYALNFFTSEFALILGLLLFSCKKKIFLYNCASHFKLKESFSIGPAKRMLVVSAGLYFFSTIIDYYLNGVPAFRDSRQGAYVGSGGLGIIERVNNVSYYILSISLIFISIYNRRNITLYKIIIFLILVLLLVTITLSGARSKIIILCGAWFYIYYYFTSSSRNLNEDLGYFCGKKGVLVLASTILVSLLVVFFSTHGDSSNFLLVAGTLLYRFVNFGDVFLYAYINDNIDYIIGDSAFIGLFGGFLSVFRLFPSSDMYVPMGLQLALIVDPDMLFVAGPNPRHNIMGYHFFGEYGGVFFSFICGAVISFFRYRCFVYFNHTFVSFILYYLFMEAIIGLFVDFQYSMSNIASVIIVGVSTALFVKLIPMTNKWK